MSSHQSITHMPRLPVRGRKTVQRATLAGWLNQTSWDQGLSGFRLSKGLQSGRGPLSPDWKPFSHCPQPADAHCHWANHVKAISEAFRQAQKYLGMLPSCLPASLGPFICPCTLALGSYESHSMATTWRVSPRCLEQQARANGQSHNIKNQNLFGNVFWPLFSADWPKPLCSARSPYRGAGDWNLEYEAETQALGHHPGPFCVIPQDRTSGVQVTHQVNQISSFTKFNPVFNSLKKF